MRFLQACCRISNPKSAPKLAHTGNCKSLLFLVVRSARYRIVLFILYILYSGKRVAFALEKKKHPLPLHLTKWALYEQLWRRAIHIFLSKMPYYLHFTVMTPPLWIKSLRCTGFSMFNPFATHLNTFQDIFHRNKLDFVSFDYKNLQRRRNLTFPCKILTRIKFNV